MDFEKIILKPKTKFITLFMANREGKLLTSGEISKGESNFQFLLKLE
jgi:hypothetical protein